MTREESFDLGAPLDTVLGGWIRWSGTMTPGLAHGDEVCGDPDDWFPWQTQLCACVDPLETGTQIAFVGPASGPFEATTPFAPLGLGSPGWPSILDGRGSVRLDLAPYFLICGEGVISPQVTVDEATLILDVVPTADVSPPPVVTNARLSAPVPNPMRSHTVLTYELGSPCVLRADVVDALGRRVRLLEARPEAQRVGSLRWDRNDDRGARQPPGIYFIRLATDRDMACQRVVVVD
jgi:hypothetical protein